MSDTKNDNCCCHDTLHAIMYSGGVDSFLTYQYLRNDEKINKTLTLIYFNLGARCTQCEIDLFNRVDFKKHVQNDILISDCLSMGAFEDEHAYIPNRNILAAIMTNSVTNASRIWIGGTLSDRVNDNNPHVCYDLSRLLSKMHNKDIVVTSPFFKKHKCDLVEDYVLTNGWGHYENQQQARYSLVESTFSCYNPLEKDQTLDISIGEDTVNIATRECLECPACFRKCMSLYAGGIFIPMRDNEKANCIVNKYYDEAMDMVDYDEVMKNRYIATIKYCEALGEYRNK